MNTQSKRLDPDYQRAVDQFVSHNVIHCASVLVADVASATAEGAFPDYQDDILSAFSGPVDYVSALNDAGYVYSCARMTGCPGWTAPDGAWLIGYESAQELCEDKGIEVEPREVFEHWIISESLADRLEQKGEKVIRDFFGFDAIWCRTTTGQAISMDDVICRIYDELQEAKA